MKKEYINPVIKTIEVDDNILLTQSDVDLVFDLENIEDEGFAD